MATVGGGGKPAGRKPRKGGKSDGKVKLTLSVSGETARRLAVHAAMAGVSKAALVESLVSAGCRRYVVSDRGPGSETAAPAEGRGGASAA